ncbi:hypothetical protein COHA_002799 [Chlorella ohadii]|uniref:Uncharacterized protein n=1 Tax=Chlorella ohadii TaxID=2649997 RepID=A0AAD5DSL3_9CHLO|nr:hypothetical protein COHA_002799 [Chlorella ohadii]
MQAALASSVRAVAPQRASRRPTNSQQRQHARRQLAVRAAGDFVPLQAVDPEDAKGAIAIGLKFSDAGNWAQAQEYFERALELPGTGLKRWRDKPPALSTGELTAALYNIACCRSRLGDIDNGLVALAGCVEQGYRDFYQLRSDPDLEALRADERFEGLLRRFERQETQEKKGFLGLF